jgi:formylglycine-generating enzyme required for sulfatase activity
MKLKRPTLKIRKAGDSRSMGHLWALLLPFYLFTAAVLDPQEVTNREYLQFIQATNHAPPESWVNGRYASGTENEPVVLVSWHEAVSYCRWIGRRLPTVDEWTSICELGKLKKRGNIWEWTSTDVDMGGQVYKALCGPSNTCDCSHRYLPEWKNEVKGFRCSRDSGPVTWLPLFREESHS